MPRTGIAQVVKDHKLTLSEPTVKIDTPKDVVVKVEFAAQNPIDVRTYDLKQIPDGEIAGRDLVGIVDVIAPEVVDKQLKGTRIAAFANGSTPSKSGAFAQWAIAKDEIYVVIPDNIAPEAAATLPVGFFTAVHGLYLPHKLGLERGGSKSELVLIWGGNSSVGRYAIQLAKLGGHKVITVASPASADELKTLGAEKVFSYKDSDVVEQINKEYGDIPFVLDAIGTPDSATTSSKTTGSSPAKYTTVRRNAEHTENFPKHITVSPIQAYRVFDEEHLPEVTVAKEYAKLLTGWLKEGKIVPNKPKVLGGLEKVEEGYQLHRDGKIHGEKLVYDISKTKL